MIKAIISDIDETLLDDKHKLPQANIDAIRKASAAGVKFVPATGRGYWAIAGILKELDLFDQANEYVISYNGCCLSENKGDKILEFRGLPYEKVKKLFDFGKDKDVCIQIYTQDKLYMYNMGDDEREHYRHFANSFTELGEDIAFLKDVPVAKMLYQKVDMPYLRRLAHEMGDVLDGISHTFSSNRYFEMNNQGVDKGEMVKVLAAKLGFTLDEVIAVGDNYNDVSMLKVAGISVAANNAVLDVKKLCTYTTTNDNNEGVLAEVIEKFVFNSI